MKQDKKKLLIMFTILASLLFFSMIISRVIDSDDDIYQYNTAIISIRGPITIDPDSGLFSETTTSSTEVIGLIDKTTKNPNVKAIIFEINSPGGSPVATDEIATKIKELKEKNITTVAWVRESGLSGAYWIASATEHIVANRMSVVGSIGVFGSYIEWYGLMNKYNVTYKRLVAGEYKDTGIPYRPLSEKEELYIQTKLDKLHDYFIRAVAENRNMSYSEVKLLATGEIFLGAEAIDNKLVDELGSEKEVLKYVESIIKEKAITKTISTKKSFIERLMEAMNKNSFYIGQGIGQSLIKNDGIKITT
ncbi:MAG: signal peptide peptidase SppA [Candidatus Woesearchaeota archaeon]|nr:MAG: signal peptide peptidase SppA [Candidatus Woesearchaeota archaeon]